MFGSVLGSKSVAPLQMAGAYATVANKGIFCEPKAIDRVVGQDGKEQPIPETTCSQVISPEVAATAAFALRGVMEGGTGSNARPNDGIQVIGKTGTAEKEHTMLVESSTKVATAVWVGNVDGRQPLARFSAYGTPLNNIRYGMAKAIQTAANSVYGGDRFPEPDGKLTRQVSTDVPNVVGKSIEEATGILEGAGFTVGVGNPVDSDLAANLVAAQDPSGQAPTGTTVTLSPSNGQGATVPAEIIGQSRGDAQSTLFGAGFTSIAFDNSCTPPNAKVVSTDPAAGTPTNKNTTITVTCQ